MYKGRCLQFLGPRFESKRGSSTRGLPLKEARDIPIRRTTMGKVLPRAGRREEAVQSEERLQKPCEDYLKGTCTNPSRGSWHPPMYQNCKTQARCRFGEESSFQLKEMDRQPDQRTKMGGEKGSVALTHIGPEVGLCISGRRAAVDNRGRAEPHRDPIGVVGTHSRCSKFL